MAVTTVAAGVGANFAGAAMVDRKPLELEAIKKGIVEGGGTIDGMTDETILNGWAAIKESGDAGILSPAGQSVYEKVNENLSQVDFQTHIQGLSIGLTIAVMVIVGAVWFLLYRKACKVAA
jgi:hypothetical protein